MSIKENLTALNATIYEYEKRYGRTPGSVKILAASKGQSLERLEQAIAAGQTSFGENYLQEALEKIAALSNKKLDWHFIGHIQANKTKKIAEHFSWVHSLCDRHIAQRLSDQRPLALPALNICIEVNISHETTKSGLPSAEALDFARFCLSLPRLKLRGLMAIPIPQKDLPAQRHELHKLQELFQELLAHGIEVDTLSMGMSDDLEAAVAEGATMVRIGKALLGKRS